MNLGDTVETMYKVEAELVKQSKKHNRIQGFVFSRLLTKDNIYFEGIIRDFDNQSVYYILGNIYDNDGSLIMLSNKTYALPCIYRLVKVNGKETQNSAYYFYENCLSNKGEVEVIVKIEALLYADHISNIVKDCKKELQEWQSNCPRTCKTVIDSCSKYVSRQKLKSYSKKINKDERNQVL